MSVASCRCALVVLALLGAAATGPGCLRVHVGERCDDEGSQANCVRGAMCTSWRSSAPTCRWMCEDDGECGSLETCESVDEEPDLVICGADETCLPDDDEAREEELGAVCMPPPMQDT